MTIFTAAYKMRQIATNVKFIQQGSQPIDANRSQAWQLTCKDWPTLNCSKQYQAGLRRVSGNELYLSQKWGKYRSKKTETIKINHTHPRVEENIQTQKWKHSEVLITPIPGLRVEWQTKLLMQRRRGRARQGTLWWVVTVMYCIDHKCLLLLYATYC